MTAPNHAAQIANHVRRETADSLHRDLNVMRGAMSEIDALIGRTVPDEETRRAQMVGDLFLFGSKWGRDALDECYRSASAWMTRDEADR